MRWIPLGTNGFFPSHGRQTMSFLVESDDTFLLLDAGTGVARLAEPAVARRLEGCRQLDVVLTHYHLDHVVGLACLSAVWGRRVRIWGPGRPLVDARGADELGRLIGPPFFPRRLDETEELVELRTYREETLEIGPFELRLRRQPHPGGSVGVRLGETLAYVTDTEEDERTVDFVGGVDTLLHEVWFLERETLAGDFDPGGHSSTTGVAGIANRAGVGRLVPIHHHPMRDASGVAEAVEELSAAAECDVMVPGEGVLCETGGDR